MFDFVKNNTPRMVNNRDDASVFNGTHSEACDLARRLQRQFSEAGFDYFVGAVRRDRWESVSGLDGPDPVTQFLFRVDHTGRENWVSDFIV